MKKYTIPAIILLSASSAFAATLSVSGTIASTSGTVAHEGTVTGTFDDVSKELNITVSFLLATTLNGMTPGVDSTIPAGVSITVGDPTVGGATALTSGSFSFVSYAENAFSGGASPTPFTGSSHVVNGAFTLNAAEEAALTGGTIFTRIDGDDADGIAALTATGVPEPSSALLSLVGLALLSRRRR